MRQPLRKCDGAVLSPEQEEAIRAGGPAFISSRSHVNEAHIMKWVKAQRKMPKDIDEYIERHAIEDQRLLRQMRATIQNAAPEATEKISYGIPTFHMNGNLVHFAAFANHIGFYPTSSGITAFKKQLDRFRSSKGAVQFPKDNPLPLTLVTKIVKFRVKENLKK